MIDLILFTGRHAVTSGATHSICNNVLKASGGSKTALIGMEIDATQLKEQPALTFDLSGRYERRALPYRVMHRLRLTLRPTAARRVDLENALKAKRDMLADRLCVHALSKFIGANRERPTWFLGLNAMSLESGLHAKKLGITYVLHSQWSHPNVQEAELQKEYDRLGIAAAPLPKCRLDRQRKELECADVVWCASSMVRDSLIENGVDASKVITVPYGIELSRYSCAPEGRGFDGKFIILMVGSLILRKGVHVLLEAVLRSRVADAEVVLNGSPDAITAHIIDTYRTRLADRRITVTARASDPRENLRRATVFVLASVEEAFGIAVLEAMAAGLPVILSSAVGSQECIEEGGNGVVFASRDADALAEHLSSFYADRGLCLRLGRRSLEVVRQYDVDSRSGELMRSLTASRNTGR